MKKTILLLAAAVLPLIMNSCSFIGEGDPFYADGHRRTTYYGRHHNYTSVSLGSQPAQYTYPNSGRSGMR
ncbi:MAG TPA: hypothetical protein VHM91_10160 [Verrucomicrobiales bacterium]|nr:hypothetical protein [Verrucomicrobiales bacterium]